MGRETPKNRWSAQRKRLVLISDKIEIRIYSNGNGMPGEPQFVRAKCYLKRDSNRFAAMNLIIELPDDAVTDLRKRAERLGVSAEAYARLVLERDLNEHRLSRAPRHISEVIAEIMSDVPVEEFARRPAKLQRSRR